jgi:hypothetical protein
MEAGQQKGKIKDLENRRVLYDTLALALAIIPIFTIWFTLLTAPAAIYIVIRYWKAPGSIIKRTKMRFILAFLIAGVQIVAWPLIGYSLFTG